MTELHPRWPGTSEPILIGDVGLVHVDGKTDCHSAYVGWWLGVVDEINRHVIRFGCGEQILSELVAKIPQLTAQNFWDLEWCGEAATGWETATDAVHGLRALGIDPPAALMAQAETVRAT